MDPTKHVESVSSGEPDKSEEIRSTEDGASSLRTIGSPHLEDSTIDWECSQSPRSPPPYGYYSDEDVSELGSVIGPMPFSGESNNHVSDESNMRGQLISEHGEEDSTIDWECSQSPRSPPPYGSYSDEDVSELGSVIGPMPFSGESNNHVSDESNMRGQLISEHGEDDNSGDDCGDDESEPFGPALPPPLADVWGRDSAESDEDIGPQPFTGENYDDAYARMRMNLECKEDESKLKREEWMLKVPKKATIYGVEARRFRRTAVEFDESWEYSPLTKRRHVEREHETTPAVSSTTSPDEEQPKLKDTSKVGQHHAAVEVHHESRKATKVKASEVLKERIPFDREKDLDKSGQKNVSLSEVKSRLGKVSSRFTPGSEQHFL
ncbi:hypothetical protein KIN20_019133 [Parelaphostrongylus tenuis]|uniref:Uncharacterized protein n=1 Tax=Parelaphostrongylus tenuis TaxID=148309 RepID=A0AAD5MKG9_PARTN|nr:hypothetical protein KIN20_019133 [Parelaphostrongylus tenuis]